MVFTLVLRKTILAVYQAIIYILRDRISLVGNIVYIQTLSAAAVMAGMENLVEMGVTDQEEVVAGEEVAVDLEVGWEALVVPEAGALMAGDTMIMQATDQMVVVDQIMGAIVVAVVVVVAVAMFMSADVTEVPEDQMEVPAMVAVLKFITVLMVTVCGLRATRALDEVEPVEGQVEPVEGF